MDKVVHNIMLESQELLQCERCSVLLVDTSVEEVSPHFASGLFGSTSYEKSVRNESSAMAADKF